ncbi:MAG TPA: tyrosine-type recombinase/integrase [Candidatus Dormibacteraeota bacterium]|nr:tyrosine-type recombinase/integrase [Candidatus Dormibacteraeota bacterium]
MRKLKVVNAEPQTVLGSLARDWLASARAGGRSPRTLEAYRWPVYKLLLPACEREGIQNPAQINQRFLDRLNAELLDSDRSPASVRSYLRSINIFLRWCEREGEGSKATAQIPKVPKKLLHVLSREEIQRLEDAATTERDKLVVRTLADTGLRLGELLGLRVQDIEQDSQGWRLCVMGKGNKERRVAVAPSLGRRLRRYAERGRPRDVNTDRLFLTTRRSGRTGAYEPLAKRTTEIMCKVLAEKAGIDPQRVWPHVFRHSYCTHLLQQNISPAKVMQLLGHSTMDMVMEVYNQLRPDGAMDDVIRALAAE